MQNVYLVIDLKTFYASVECVERNLDPFSTNLVVADPARGTGAICLAISPKMKMLGIKNRCRIYEIPKNIQYITAVPRMRLYEEYSANIYDGQDSSGTYLGQVYSGGNTLNVECSSGQLYIYGVGTLTITGSKGATSANPSQITKNNATITVTMTGGGAGQKEQRARINTCPFLLDMLK